MSELLLDTYVLLWASNEPDRLGPRTRNQLQDPSHRLFVSAVSYAEIAIKRSIGKLVLTVSIEDLLAPLGAQPLALSAVHATAIERLPMLHRDPFDRMLAAQASCEDYELVTADECLLAYPVATRDART